MIKKLVNSILDKFNLRIVKKEGETSSQNIKRYKYITHEEFWRNNRDTNRKGSGNLWNN